MSEFDKHWDEWAIASNCTEDEAKIHFEAGQQSQQAKIDCMQVRLDGANERAMSLLNHKNRMVDKMQAEIDAITKQRDSFIKAHHIAMNDVCEHKAKIDELQGRIDEAIGSLKLVNHALLYEHIDHIINLLDGTTNEQ